MKRYKYRALVKLDPEQSDSCTKAIRDSRPCRATLRVRHPETGVSHFFPAWVTPGSGGSAAADDQVGITVAVVGDDAGDYLSAGQQFAIWSGTDVAEGVVVDRVFI
jgi:hypothetical protein